LKLQSNPTHAIEFRGNEIRIPGVSSPIIVLITNMTNDDSSQGNDKWGYQASDDRR